MNYIAAKYISPAENDFDNVYKKQKNLHAFTYYEWWIYLSSQT